MSRLFLVGLVCLGLALPVAADETESLRVEFTWPLAAFSGAGRDDEWVEITDDDSAVQDNKLGSDDKLKMLVELRSPCFVYVLHHDAGDRLQLLFPASLPHPPAAAAPGKRHFIPADGAWLAPGDASGEETFYVVAAARRLSDLEQLLEQYGAAQTDDERQKRLETTLDHIAELQAKHLERDRVLRKPASIGGAVRSLSRAFEIKKYAEEISAGSFFSATYTIQR